MVAVVVAKYYISRLGALYAFGNLTGGQSFPIQTVHAPLYRVQSKRRRRIYKLIVVVAERRTKQRYGFARYIENFLLLSESSFAHCSDVSLLI